jgi:hypothetical protein
MAPIIARAAVDRPAAQVFGFATDPLASASGRRASSTAHMSESDPGKSAQEADTRRIGWATGRSRPS